jgi:hypothetical protein
VQNWTRFSELLLNTGDLPIVEQSRKDRFWGAVPVEGKLVGANVLGRLLMELRETVRQGGQFFEVLPPVPEVDRFLLFGKSVGRVAFCDGSDLHKVDSLF